MPNVPIRNAVADAPSFPGAGEWQTMSGRSTGLKARVCIVREVPRLPMVDPSVPDGGRDDNPDRIVKKAVL